MSTSYILNHLKFRKWFTYFVCIFALLHLSINLFYVALKAGNNWATGEWLINYGGGFIRRGFFGELLLRITPEGNSVIYFLLLMQFGLVVCVWLYLLQFAKRSQFSSTSLLLVLSPAGISFVSWDRYLFVRKEILGIVLVIFIFKLLNLDLKREIKVVLGILLFVGAVLSSEVNFFFLPSIVYLIITSTKLDKLEKAIWMLSLFLASCILAILIVFYAGDEETPSSVCARLMEHGLQSEMNCHGAVAMLSVTLKEAVNQVLANLPESLIYGPILAVGLYPVYKCWPEQIRKTWIAFIILGVSPLFFIAWDYGRWIFIIVIQLSLIVIFYHKREGDKTNSREVTGLFLVSYTTLWGFAHTGNIIANGWIGLVPSTIRYLLELIVVARV
jgi:hypothetical protein